MKKHQKHAAIKRPAYGEFHSQEWAVLGAPCGEIQALTAHLIRRIAQPYRLSYVDADHAAGDAAEKMPVENAALVYTDKINYHRYDVAAEWNTFQRRPVFAGTDGVLVNGNHFKAKRQIVILDPRKKESLQRKLDRLTDVALILTTPEQKQPYDFLQEHLGDQRPILMPVGDINGILQWLRAQLTAARPPLYGLVLAGGKSQRMGQDKGVLDYHGKPQREYVYSLLQPHCKKVYFSVVDGQSNPPEGDLIPDSFIGLGPFGAILSAFRKEPEAAWLVVACDLPLLDKAALQELTKNRNTSRIATAFYNPATEFPDPLLTIWEPRAYPVLLQFLAQGYSCPRKVLINSPIEMIKPARPEILHNANTPEERDAILANLQN